MYELCTANGAFELLAGGVVGAAQPIFVLLSALNALLDGTG